VAAWVGNRPESEAFLPWTVRRMCRLSILGYVWSVLILTIMLAGH